MASKFVCIVNTNNDAKTTASEIAPNVASNPHTTGADAGAAIKTIGEFFGSQVLGRGINVVYCDTAIAASGTGTFTGIATADQTMTIAGATFTAKASPDESANEYLVSADVTLAAASLARAINAAANVAGIVTATSNLGVVTITSAVPGTIGNGISTIDVDTSNFTFAQANLAAGSESHRTTLSSGL